MSKLALMIAACCLTGCNEEDTTEPVHRQGPVDEMYSVLAGAWTCDTSFPAGSQGPGSPAMTFPASLAVTRTLGGAWYRGVLVIDDPEHPFSVEFFLGREPIEGKALLVGVDTLAGTSTGVAPSWDGNTIQFEGAGIGPAGSVKTRESLTMRGHDRVDHRLEIDVGAGFMTLVETTCAR